MARPLSASSSASSTTIAAEVFSTKPRLTSSDHRNTCTGSTVAGSLSLVGGAAMKARIPISSSGAVSPNARAVPMIVPVRMPGIASGRTWWNTTCTGEAPTLSAASRIDGGTALIALRAVMTITGIVINASVRAPTIDAERVRPKVPRKTASPSSPKMIEGTAARLLIETSIRSVQRFLGAYSSR